MKKNSDNDSKNNEKNNKTDKNLESESIFDREEPKISSLKISKFKFNIYKKGKRMSKQFAKMKNDYNDFLFYLSLDSNKDNQNQNSKSKNKLPKKTDLEIKINSSNTLPSLSTEKNNKSKKLSLTLPKMHNDIEKNTSKKPKQKHIFKSVEFRTTNLNKLYGYNKKFLTFKENLKKSKDLELAKYQEDILRLSSINLSREHLLKLYTDLKNIRINSEEVKPYPPINFRSLIIHSLTKNKKMKKGGFMPKKKKFTDMDEYEKEMFRIKMNAKYEKKNSNNKLMYKMYEILPEHIVEKIYAKKRKF
jgi:hypothetical protein